MQVVLPAVVALRRAVERRHPAGQLVERVQGERSALLGRGTESAGDGEQTITALVPTSEVLRYAIDLRSITGGRGRFVATHSHYDPAPPQLADKIVAEAAAARDA